MKAHKLNKTDFNLLFILFKVMLVHVAFVHLPLLAYQVIVVLKVIVVDQVYVLF